MALVRRDGVRRHRVDLCSYRLSTARRLRSLEVTYSSTALQWTMVRSMPIRDRGSDDVDAPFEKIEDRLMAVEEVIAAQARSTRDLTSRIEEFQSAIKIVQTIQDDFRTQRATREAWA